MRRERVVQRVCLKLRRMHWRMDGLFGASGELFALLLVEWRRLWGQRLVQLARATVSRTLWWRMDSRLLLFLEHEGLRRQ